MAGILIRTSVSQPPENLDILLMIVLVNKPNNCLFHVKNVDKYRQLLDVVEN